MTDRVLIASATNLLERGFQVVPLDRTSRQGEPVNALFAVARALTRDLEFKAPLLAVAIVDPNPKPSWPQALTAQLPRLSELCQSLGLPVVESSEELELCASYVKVALEAGQDVVVAGVDKRLAQLVSERTWWFDANKDVRYTEEIVQKRFGVPPAQVAEWLALVGDEAELPGVKGIGAKGATEFLLEHGSMALALEQLGALEGRVAKALRAEPRLAEKLAQARLRGATAVPVPLERLHWTPPSVSALNALYEALGFTELLMSTGPQGQATVLEDAQAAAAFVRAAGPMSLHALLEPHGDAGERLVGLGLSAGAGAAYIPATSPAWPVIGAWLADERAPKEGHDLVGTMVALRHLGITLRGVVSDSACLSHLTQPSNWAPHELWLVARQALGEALPDDDEVLGTGQTRKRWSALPVEHAASVAERRASTSWRLCRLLGAGVEPRLVSEYLELSETLVRMELTGIGVDVTELERAQASFAEIERTLDAEIARLAGKPFNVNSSRQLGDVLFGELKLPVVSHTRTGWSTANDALERIRDAHPIVPLVIRWRGLRRLRDSWLVSLRRCVGADGRVHSRCHLARSFAGDLINSNPDLGRVPGRTPEMARVRRAFVARPGWVLMSVDFNQLGLHVLAHLTKDPALVEPLRARADLHRLTAAAIFEKAPDAVTAEERQVGKVVNFATFAGQGASALGLQLGITPAQAKAYLERFDRRYAKVRGFQDEQLRLAREQGFIQTIAGRRWPIGGLESLDAQLRSYAERLAKRATHEGSVADVSRRALLRADQALRREGLRAAPLVQILDEVLFEVPEDELTRAAELCSSAMRGAYELEVPLVVGVEAGPNWADLEPLAR